VLKLNKLPYPFIFRSSILASTLCKEHRFNYVDAKFGLDFNVYICDSFRTSGASQELTELSILHPHKLGNECIK
jgi:hypothetical protein